MGLFNSKKAVLEDIAASLKGIYNILKATKVAEPTTAGIKRSRLTGWVGERRVFRAAGGGTIPLFRVACENCRVNYKQQGSHFYCREENERTVVSELKALLKKR